MTARTPSAWRALTRIMAILRELTLVSRSPFARRMRIIYAASAMEAERVSS